MTKRLYNTILQSSVAAGAAVTGIFFIDNLNRHSKINSIFFDIILNKETLPVAPYPLEQNITQEYHLEVTALPIGTRFGNIYSDFTPALGVIANGDFIFLHRVGQYYFDSFFINNNARFTFDYNNHDLLN